MRGIHLENPVCDCPERHLSRAQAAGEGDKQVIPRAVHYRCAKGGCNFFSYGVDEQGEVLVLVGGRLDAEEMEGAGV